MKNEKKKMIEKALKTGGFAFPQTVQEVKEFERLFGSTDVILPAELQNPTFLDPGSKTANNIRVVKFPCDNFAMAARDGANSLPDKIRLQIVDDIKRNENKKKGKKNK